MKRRRWGEGSGVRGGEGSGVRGGAGERILVKGGALKSRRGQ